MSRVGYGPSAELIRAVQAATSPRAWALAQLDLAWAASQNPPRMAVDGADFNAPLPRIFEGSKAERDARAKVKAVNGDDAPTGAPNRPDFSDTAAPEHFSRNMVQQTAAWRLTSG